MKTLVLTQTEKVKFIVVDENTLCYTNPNTSMVNILSASVVKGAANISGFMAMPMSKSRVRPACRQDFIDFRVDSTGYESDPNYEFPET